MLLILIYIYNMHKFDTGILYKHDMTHFLSIKILSLHKLL